MFSNPLAATLRLSRFVRQYQKMQAGVSDNWIGVRETMIKLPMPAHLISASAHEVVLSVVFRRRDWLVRIVPTFHGPEVKVAGKDFGAAKTEISKQIQEAFQ